MVDYEAMHLALVRRLVEIADEIDSNSKRTLDEYNQDRLADYDRVAREGEWWARRDTQEDSDG